MQQVLIHVIPIFFALYMYVSLFHKTRLHWAIRGVLLFLFLISCQYPAFCRSFFVGYDDRVPHLGIVLYCWLFSTQLLLVLATFAKDFVGLIYRLVRKTKLPHPTTTAVSLLSIAMLIAAFGSYSALSQPPIYRLDVPIKNLPDSLDGFTIAQLSDIHASPLLDRSRLVKVVERTNALKPDMVAVTGDIVDGKTEARLQDVSPLKELRAPYGVFAVEGNHEHYVDYDAWMATYPTLNMTVLHNSHRILDVNGAKLAIVGITDPMAARYHREYPDVKKAMSGIPEGTVSILLSHQVKYSRDYAKYPIALQLSGHTHGGQIFGMHWLAQIINKGFVKDKYQIGDMLLYVNRGTGLWYGFPIRLGIPSEITLVTLKKKN